LKAIFGDLKNHERHANGLEKVLEKRGGLRSLAPGRLAARNGDMIFRI
jgi:hypothetical protein